MGPKLEQEHCLPELAINFPYFSHDEQDLNSPIRVHSSLTDSVPFQLRSPSKKCLRVIIRLQD